MPLSVEQNGHLRLDRAQPDAPSDFCHERPAELEPLCATNLPEALALRNCLRTLRIFAQMGSTPQTGPWVHVWVAPRQIHKAKLVYRGFLAGLGVRP